MDKNENKKATGIVIFISAIAFFLLAGFFMPAYPSNALTKSQIEDEIARLTKTLESLQNELSQIEGGGAAVSGIPSGFMFNKNLALGSRGTDVLYLQKLLNMSAATKVAVSGSGSPGNETMFFGPRTIEAVIKFQNLYKDAILTPVGLNRGTGFFGKFSRDKANAILGQTGGGGGGNHGASLMISNTTQPMATLVPQKAARVPFTKFMLTAGNGGSVAVKSVLVRRGGLASDSIFKGIVLLDENGNQIGLSRALDSNHEVLLNEQFTVPSGQSKIFTIAANMNSNLSSFSGQTASLSLEKVNLASASTTLTGASELPIIGAMNTINSSLDIGTASLRVGSLGLASATKEIGTKNYTFSSFVMTSGSNEKLKLKSIMWHQSGSASQNDISNVKTVVDGVLYDAIASPDGKIYTSNFGSGIIINKGISKEISVRADIDSGSGRTIIFDIDNASDINVSGETFGFGIMPNAETVSSPSDSTAEFTNVTPFFDGAAVNISGAAITVSKSNTVASQNIGVGIPNQILGGFLVNVKGEEINIQNSEFGISIARVSGSGADADNVTDITLTDSSGTVLSGPRDAEGITASGTVAFNSSINLTQGDTTIILKGKLANNFKDGDRITISLKPSSDLMDIRGSVSGNVLTASPSSQISANAMTVRGASLSLTVSPVPIAQSVVAGTQDFTFANFVFDASNSNEDLRLTSLPAQFTASAHPENLSGCSLFKDSMSLTTGSNMQNPSSSFVSGNNLTFILDNSLVLAKGMVTTISLKCDISGSATVGATYKFGLDTAPSLTGVDSLRTVSVNLASNAGQTMTISGGGALTVSKSSASPSYQIGVGGATITAGVLRFRATSEAVKLNQLGLEFTGPSSSSTPSDLTNVALFNGATQVGTAVFTGNRRFATSTLSGDFTIPQNESRDLTIKLTLANIGVNQPGTEGALIKIDYDGNNASTTQGVGVSSGSLITSATMEDTDFPGVRLFNTAPTFLKDTVPSSTLSDGERVLMRFKVSADNAHDVGIEKFTLKFGESGVSVSGVNIFAFTDSSYSSPVSGINSGGQLDNTNKSLNSNDEVEIYSENSSGTQTPLQVPSGGTRYFEVRGTVSGVSSGDSITTTLEGDTIYPSLSSLMGTVSQVDATSNSHDNFIWSPNKNGESSPSDTDWTNGFGVSGLPSGGFSETLSR